MNNLVRRFPALKTASLVLPACLALSACVAPIGPVEVTRFHSPDTHQLGSGTIRVEPGYNQTNTLEFKTYASAVARELTVHGYSEILPNQVQSTHVALLTLNRETIAADATRNPISVGLGGGTGGYGSGVGLGVGFNLSGKPKDQIITRIFVAIRERNAPEAATSLWEGRASFMVDATSPLAQSTLGAAKMTEALFKDFPGKSGETIQVK